MSKNKSPVQAIEPATDPNRMDVEYAKQCAFVRTTETIPRPLTEDELTAQRFTLSEKMIALGTLQEEFKKVQKSFAELMNPLKEASQEILKSLRDKMVVETIDCYQVPNLDTSDMEYVNVTTGQIVYRRRLLPNERQANIFQLSQAE